VLALQGKCGKLWHGTCSLDSHRVTAQHAEGETGKKTEVAMDYRTLITLGRKAGLQTSELYQALSARRPVAWLLK
jgi:hypothetical protein